MAITGLASAQYSTKDINVQAAGDLTVPLGHYDIGSAIWIEAELGGPWAQDGGVYHIVGDWNQTPKVLYRGESSISQRLKFYGYVDPSNSGYAYLFVTWENQSPNKADVNSVHLHITSTGAFDTSNTGDFSLAQQLTNILVVQSNTERVGIGTANPDKKLTVDGTVKAREVIVSDSAGADFVFNKHYHLNSLSELDEYIKEKGHLPGIPSAQQLKREGMKVGEFQNELLQNVEELSLYVIALNKKVDSLETENRRINSSIH